MIHLCLGGNLFVTPSGKEAGSAGSEGSDSTSWSCGSAGFKLQDGAHGPSSDLEAWVSRLASLFLACFLVF